MIVSQFLPDKTQRHVQGMDRPMEYLFKGSTLAKGMQSYEITCASMKLGLGIIFLTVTVN